MTARRLLIHTVFVILLPVVVAWLGLSIWGAILLVLLSLAWRWAIAVSGILKPEDVPVLELETIAASHFVEKVRWCMDRLGVDYHERQVAGVLGVFFTGRSVPKLKIRTGMVRSSIGNSPEILRYLWGAFAATPGVNAAFLEPTRERLELEKKLDRYGVNLQVWVYHHILHDRKLTQHAWGCYSPAIPAWQRHIVILIFPVLRAFLRKAFRITDTHYSKAVGHIESILAEVDELLSDGRHSILGGDAINFTDIAFASFSGLWLQPPGYGCGKAEDVRIERCEAPPAMQADIDGWVAAYPGAAAFIERLYQQERSGS